MAIDQLHITLLVDNHATSNLMAEHGLAMWIETPDHRILFDTGQGPALVSNANKLDISLDNINMLVLSHGHYDHSGGVAHVLQSKPSVELYCHPAAVQPRYSIRPQSARALSMPEGAMAALDKMPNEHLHWISRPVQITEDIGLTGPIPRESDLEDTGGPFFLDPDARREDTVDDDLAMWLNTPQGLVVCVGCAHAGLINTLSHVRRLSGVTAIRAVIGGFHLHNANSERIRQTVSQLKTLSPTAIIACHCTGNKAISALKKDLGNRVSKGYAGMRLQF